MHFYFQGHNDLKYLGSTGFLPAVQTYICGWNNTCHNIPNPDDPFSTFSNNALFVFFYY
jgi:hypothetical protein